jgi:aminoglycoside phosphotransferase
VIEPEPTRAEGGQQETADTQREDKLGTALGDPRTLLQIGTMPMGSDISMRPMRHGYSNDTRGDGSSVAKRYAGPDRDLRRDTEHAMLVRLGAHLPLPHLITAAPGALVMEHVGGLNGQQLIEAGHAARVLRSCGDMLRRIQRLDVTTAFPETSLSPDTVLVHGDYGPHNLLFDPVTFAVTAVLDWEWAHPGGAVEDLAWCEWIIRTHHPEHIGAVEDLFSAYGDRPMWADRRDAMLAKCRRMLARPREQGAPGVRRWRQCIDDTLAWTE